MTEPKTRQKLCLIDGSSYFFRAYFAIGRLSNRQGFPTNAIYGFANMLQKVVNDEKPDFLAVVYDSPAPTFRKKIYAEYKANRTEMPEDLAQQIPFMKELVAAENIFSIERPGFEADDIIATLVKHFEKSEALEISIVSSDKDLMQLVNERVYTLDTMKGVRFGPKEVEEKMGVRPEQVRDVLALAGDTSDNIPGVPGIGLKTAAQLIREYGDLESLLARVDTVKGDAKRNNLKTHAADARLSQTLVALAVDVPIDFDLTAYARKPRDLAYLERLYEKFEFRQLLEKIRAGRVIEQPSLTENATIQIAEDFREHYRALQTIEQLRDYLRPIREHKRPLSVDTETTSVKPMTADLVGISLCADVGQGVYIPVAHQESGTQQIPLALAVAELRGLLEDPTIAKFGQNLKYDQVVLRRHGIRLKGLQFDSMLASYLLAAENRGTHNLDALSQRYLNHRMITYLDVTQGLEGRNFSLVPIAKAMQYAAEDADVVFRLFSAMKPQLESEGVYGLSCNVECPLSEILGEMEFTGIAVDRQRLERLSVEFEEECQQLTTLIHEMAGGPFLISSPKQLQHVLFDKMNLPKGRKIKTGFSTDNEVLEDLALSHEIAHHLLRFRALTKLKNTYVDVLPTLIHPQTGRVHTTFNQAIAATGRLSSSDPNLQNIPVRGHDAERIREAFIPAVDHQMMAADYSQVELRVFAHFSNDASLTAAYHNNQDVHDMTAQAIFQCGPESVDRERRRQAKTVNFGILYGISDFGLSRQLRISPSDAKKFIERYFVHYQGVRKFLDEALVKARQEGFAVTYLGRRRKLPDLVSKNVPQRKAAERMAISTIIQGSAADLIKVAMINVHRAMQAEGFSSKMTLQVHDELLFDVASGEAEALEKLVKREMESAFTLQVPLLAEIHLGANWLAAGG